MINFFKLLISNWQGGVIGLSVALIIGLILQLTAFKGNKIAWILSLILCIGFGFAGVFIQNQFFNKNSKIELPGNDEVMNIITDNVEKGWTNTNGGFTFEQIMTSQNDDDCPIFSDQVINMTVQDYGEYVCFYYKNGDIYENATFLKSEYGLVLDGMLNMTGDFNTRGQFHGILPWVTVMIDEWYWVNEQDKVPYFYTQNFGVGIYKFNDLISCAKKDASFMRNDHFNEWYHELTVPEAVRQGSKLTGKNAVEHFIRFGDVELIGEKATSSSKINTFYNYLYNQIKSNGYNTRKLIDVTPFTCVPIPDKLQSSYPISADKKAEYDNADYYGVYKCDIAFNCLYEKGNEVINTNDQVDQYIEDELKGDNSDKVKVEDVDYIPSDISVLQVSLNKSSQSDDISQVDFLNNPVTITFKNQELNLTKILIIDSYSKITSTSQIILEKGTWSYEISSNVVLFEKFLGNFKIEKDNNLITFNYEYHDNFIVASVCLNPVSTIDKTQINLSTYPVKIILNNSKHTYQFLFNSNSMLDEKITQMVELGQYAYTILSEQLLFAQVTGTLEITNTDRIMAFNYGLNLEAGSLKFNIDVATTGSTTNKLQLYSDGSNVDLIRQYLPTNKVYDVLCFIYSEDGKILEQFSHRHLSIGNCGDLWSFTKLTTGNTYTMQLRFVSSEDDTITFLSDVKDFVYDASQAFKVTYTVTEV